MKLFRKAEPTKPTNAESIKQIPATHITPEYRATLMARAKAGEDVYAYGSTESPTGIINVWDIDTRIPLYPLAQECWHLDDSWYSQMGLWGMRFTSTTSPEHCQIQICIKRREDETPAAYQERGRRVMQMLANDINLYLKHPQMLRDGTF